MSPAVDPYVQHVTELERRLDHDDALRKAVGGEFVAVGKLEYQLLRSLGLRDDHVVVDVGCGSGRLACQLSVFSGVRYLGVDVVPALLAYAEKMCRRPDWKFLCTEGTSIPVAEGTADFVCFFSVFTHLSHEDIFRYIREAHRALKPGGKVVMSFLEFGISGHWETFIASVDGTRDNSHLNQFFGPDAVRAWASQAGFAVSAIHRGDTQYIPLTEPVRYESGEIVTGYASLGQSLAVLQKPDVSSPAAAAAVLRNVSVRGYVRPSGTLYAGFVIGGIGHASVLVRAVGPTLAKFGVSQTLRRPEVSIRDQQGGVAEHRGWVDDEATRAAFARAGAFPLNHGSDDVVALLTLPPDAYSVVARSTDPTDAGEVLIEVYQLG